MKFYEDEANNTYDKNKINCTSSRKKGMWLNVSSSEDMKDFS